MKNKYCPKHDTDYYIGCNSCTAGLALQEKERQHTFIHNPVEAGGNAYNSKGDVYHVLEVQGALLKMRNTRTDEANDGMHWANMNYSGVAMQNAMDTGAQDLMTWLMKQGFFERTAAENILTKFIDQKHRDRLGLPEEKEKK